MPNEKLMKKLLCISILFIFSTVVSFSENPHIAVHLSNPLGLIQKAGIKLEYRQAQTGLLVFATQYYGALPDYPGTQLGIEGRRYLMPKAGKRSDIFFYGKILGGYQQERLAYGEGFFNNMAVVAGYYYGLGAGIGTHINFNHFFIEFNGGFKGVFSTTKQELPFYATGPGSIVDLHFNLGFQY